MSLSKILRAPLAAALLALAAFATTAPAPALAQASAPAAAAAEPAAATRAEVTGTTKIRFTIDSAGKMVKSEVVRSAGSTREHRLLDRVAMEKLGNCNFTPGIDEQGKPTGGTFDVDYVWKLE